VNMNCTLSMQYLRSHCFHCQQWVYLQPFNYLQVKYVPLKGLADKIRRMGKQVSVRTCLPNQKDAFAFGITTEKLQTQASLPLNRMHTLVATPRPLTKHFAHLKVLPSGFSLNRT
jgi:hypothetical protein